MTKLEAKPRKTPPQKKGGLLLTLIIVAITIAAVGIVIRIGDRKVLARNTTEAAITAVAVIEVSKGPGAEDIVLPGNVQAWHEAPIYARTSGYLKVWKVDIGTPVKAGDLLAEIETPEIDAQLKQAQADLATAEANNKLAQSTTKRWQQLLVANAVSKQDAENKAGAAASSVAALASARANLDRLKELEGFKRIIAPFDGIITARNTDRGALINAGSNGTGPELFHIVETDKLRVYAQVPQTYVNAISPDIQATIELAEHPGRSFPAKLLHTSDALDPTSRTLLIQLEVDNARGELLPGGYAQVHLKLPSSGDAVHLPVNTLLFRSEGMQVAVVGADGKIVLKSIEIGRDFGKEVEVKSGIAEGEKVIINPPDSIVTGQEVRIVSPGKAGGKS